MSSLLGILVVVLGLLVSVGLHEVGHMLPAKRFGALVPEYSVGFGPALWKRTWRGTTYVLRPILLGGYVRILGMYPPAHPGTRTVGWRGRRTLAEEARLASAAEVPEGMEDRAFHALPPLRRAVVMAAGPVTNLLISLVLITVALVGVGVPTPTTTLGETVTGVQTSEGEVAGPARAAGLRAGDTVLDWGGTPTPSWAALRSAIARSDGAGVPVVIERAGHRATLVVTPVRDADGAWVAGVVAGIDRVPATPPQVAAASWQVFTGTASVVARLPMALWDVGAALVSQTPRDPSGVVSVVGVGRIAGEITSSGDSPGVDTRSVASQLLALLASLNMALFVFNLLPLPPLDGGHVVGALYEALRRGIARAVGRGDTHFHADTAAMMPITYAVGAFFVAMTLLLVVADVVDPITLGG